MIDAVCSFNGFINSINIQFSNTKNGEKESLTSKPKSIYWFLCIYISSLYKRKFRYCKNYTKIIIEETNYIS